MYLVLRSNQMSASTFVVARRKLTDEEFKKILTYNSLIDLRIDPPEVLVRYVASFLGNEYECGQLVKLPEKEQIFETHIKTMWDNGVIVDLLNLPPGTIALRIYRA